MDGIYGKEFIDDDGKGCATHADPVGLTGEMGLEITDVIWDLSVIKNNQQFIGTVYIDFDDTITESSKNVIGVLGRRRNWTEEKINEKRKCNNKWNFDDIFIGKDTLKENELRMCFRENVFKDLKFFEEAKEVINRLYMDKYKIVFVTVGEEINIKNKKAWLNEMELPYHEMHGVLWDEGHSKGCVDMSDGFFIDDRTKNLLDCNAKYKILFKGYGDAKLKNRTLERDWQITSEISNLDDCYIIDNSNNTGWREIDTLIRWLTNNPQDNNPQN